MNMEFKCHHEEEEEEDSKAVSSSEEEEEEAAVCVRSYECVFCKRGFATAQALGGHMNIHRKDRAANKTSRPTVSTQLGGDHVSPYRAIQGYPVRPHDYNHHHHYDYDYGYDYYYYSSSRTTGTTAHVNYQTFDINMITPAAVAASTWGLRLPQPPEVVLVGHRSHPFCPPNSLHPKYPYTSPQEEEEEDDDDDHDHNQNGGCSISTLELDLELRLGYGP